MNTPLKPWKSIDEQLDILIQRGMLIGNSEIAKSYLEKLGYYRLSGYWYPFREIAEEQDEEAVVPKRLDQFVAYTHFSHIVDLYIFDKKLRLLALDALERIEMAVRVDIAHLLGERDACAHENPKCLHGRFSKQLQKKGRAKGKTAHQLWLEKFAIAVHRARREPFVSHYQSNYGKLPIWVAVEVWDFGMMSMLYSGMKISDQDKIAEKYGAEDGKTFAAWLRSLNFIRNISAHHSRLWNINVLERAPVPAYEHWQLLHNSRPFFYFCLMQKMLQIISPNSSWASRFQMVTLDFPVTGIDIIDLQDFGVVEGWEGWPIWGLK